MPDCIPLVAFNEVSLLSNGPLLNWEIEPGQHWLITGDSEPSKIELFDILAGKKQVSSGTISHSLEVGKTSYSDAILKNSFYVNFLHPSTLLPDAFYQQRYHASESETGPTLREFIASHLISCEHLDYSRDDAFEFNERLDERIIHLSTGEFRKLTIILGLAKNTRLLLLYEPYSGLDPESIQILDSVLLNQSEKGLCIILASESDHIPSFITHCLNLNHLNYFMNVRTLLSNSLVGSLHATTRQKSIKTATSQQQKISLQQLNSPFRKQSPEFNFKIAFSIKDLSIHDGHKKLLDSVNWTVRRGEKWALLGRNGAGKSMMLSVIFADHPQAYANQLDLFDRKRGSGESIWEIRERIGYFSSELFLYADKNITCRDLVYRNIRSNPYKFNAITKWEETQYNSLMDYFSLGLHLDVQLNSLPPGMQRLVFLISVFLKNAPLIILDEPFHGFDQKLIEKIKDFLNYYCQNRTFVIVTHRKNEIPAVTDKFFILTKGKGEIKSD
jgi:molybdate transport system ATP-binding protein